MGSSSTLREGTLAQLESPNPSGLASTSSTSTTANKKASKKRAPKAKKAPSSTSKDIGDDRGSSNTIANSRSTGRKGRRAKPSSSASQPPPHASIPATKRGELLPTEPTSKQLQSISNKTRNLIDSLREGQRVRIVLADGAEFEGDFSSSTRSTCHLIMVQQKKTTPTDVSNGTTKRDLPNPNMSFQKRDISDARAVPGKAEGKAQNGNAAGFRTDSAISSGRPASERVLQRWVPDASDGFDQSLEKPSGSGHWDQFAANEQKFGLKTDYDENFYTTRIDKSHPQYRERVAAAEKKAREIERSVATTSHVAEERVMDHAGGDDRGGDEEEKYSGVKRQDFPPLTGNRENKYTLPARRAPTGATTVKGAPVDPAIISSQLKTTKTQPATPKSEDAKTHTASTPTPDAISTETSTAPPPPVMTPEPKSDTKTDIQQKSAESKTTNQVSTPLRPSAATSRTISPQAKEGTTPNATSTVERDVLKEFKTFANQQRMNAEKVRSTKMKADKEVKLTELKNFARGFKLPTPVPVDLIGIIAKDPAKQREIQEKAQRDVAEVARRKADDAAAKEKKPTTPKDAQTAVAAVSQGAPAADRARPSAVPSSSATAQPAAPAAAARHQGGRGFVPQQYPPFRNDRSGPQNIPQGGRQTAGLSARLRNVEHQKAIPDVRQPPTGPANPTDPSFARRPGGIPSHMGPKLNPNSNEFRPLAAPFVPNGHPSAGSSPRSAINNTSEAPSGPANANAALVVITKKKNAVDPKKCNILSFVKSLPVPQGKNWDENQGIKPSFDTPPTWRQALDDEKPESTMRLSYTEFFERQPFATQPTPNPSHVMPQMAHQHQLPFHLQHGAHSVGPRHSPHVPSVQMHPGQHGPVPHVPFNGADDHRMMHSNSSQSFSSPRMGHVPIAYPPNMNSPGQMQYNQNVMPTFIPGAPQMGQYGRSFSNNPQYAPQQQMQMGAPVMMQPQFMTHQGMPAPQMHMYPSGGQQFMPPGAAVPQQMAGTNGYPSPGRPAAPMMVHQGSQQGQPIYGMSPGMQYQQPAFPQQPGQMNTMRGYSNPGQHQFGTSPQQMHQYGPQQQQHRNGSNGFKGYTGHNQAPVPQGGHQIPTGPQGRTPDGQDEAK